MANTFINIVRGLLVVYCYLTCSNCASTTKYVSYNSSDISYLSNGIQIPVQPVNEQDPIIEELESQELPHMQWISQLYDHHNWKKRLEILDNTKCRDDLSIYLYSLQNGTLWAVKMHDASGRYSSQFFFGNDYWLGSSTLCSELQMPEVNMEVPPFPTGFFVAKIRINIDEDLTPVTRQLNLGQCLPSSCAIGDVRRLLVQERSQGTSLSVVGVRSVPGDYSLLHDLKFHIIGGVAIVVFVITVIATGVEYHINRKRKKNKKDNELENNNGTNISKEHIKIHLESIHQRNLERNKTSSAIVLTTNLLLCFSALKNGKKIVNVDPPPKGSIKCLHGLRFFSIAWIILVHTYLEVFAVADNKSLRIVTERTFLYQTISNATFSVDTFFFISGLLVTLGYLKRELKKPKPTEHQTAIKNISGGVFKYLILLFYRYIRLTPAYLFVLGLNELAMRYLHSYSVFSPAIIDHLSCTQYWWRNALYINNFYPQREFCMLWSWYMSNDTQFFAMAMILLTLAARNEKWLRGIGIAIVTFMVTSWITTFSIAMKYNYVARIEEPFALFDELYDKPWLRVGPYLVGMITGYALLKLDGKKSLPKSMVASCWMLSLACLASLIYGVGRDGLQVPISAFYASLGHTAWGLSVAWITIACYMGYGGPVDSVLSFRGILPLSRLSYCTYLVHPMLMCITSFLMDGPIHLHHSLTMVIYCGNIVISFIFAFIISLGFEAPFVQLLKILSGKKS